jgi:iron complex outermembrane receptor protein
MPMQVGGQAVCLQRAWVWVVGASLGPVLFISNAAAQVLEPVVITGSHLQSQALEGALPVQVISRTDILRSGATTAAQLLGQVSINQPFKTEAMAVGSYGPAAFAGANLRGLGESGTLVLVNGRRIAQHAGTNGTATDLNAIPLAAVERVEILKDGASAIYGADAVGGVINFILRRDYEGVDLQLDLSRTSQGGGGNKALSLTAGGGLGDSGIHWTGSFSWQKEQALAARQRSFSKSADVPGLINVLSYGTWPAGVSDSAGNFYSPSYPDCRPPYTVADPEGSGYCLFDYAASVDLLPAVDRLNGFLRADGTLSTAWHWYAEGMASRITQRMVSSPAYVSGMDPATGAAIYPTLSAASPYYPGSWAAANGVSGDLTLDWRMVDQGPRGDRHQGDQQRWLAGLQGQWDVWSVDTAVSSSQHRLVSAMTQGYYRVTDVQSLLDAGVLNPFGTQSAAAQTQLDTASLRDRYSWMKTGTQSMDVKASRAFGALPGGPVALALGGEWRRETLSIAYSSDVIACVISGGVCGGFDLNQGRNVAALFGELSLPFAKDWEAQLALRHDRYGVGGKATTPKVALRWRMAPQVAWRASLGRGFIAPSLEQLYAPPVFETAAGGPFDDSARCATTGDQNDCRVEFSALRGGSRQLSPETSRQLGLGLVLGNSKRWSASVDAWAIQRNHKIDYVPAGTIFSDLPLYEALGYVTRYEPGNTPAGTTCLVGPDGPVCPIQYVDGQYRNLGRQKTAGVDLTYQWRSQRTAWGTWTLGADGTWVQQFKTQLSTVSAYVDQLGRYTLSQPVPRWRHSLQANLTEGDWSWTLGQRYVASYLDYNPDPTLYADRRVSAAIVWDAQVAYRLNETAGITWGVRNLLDTDPPASRQQNSFQVGYDPHFADPRGRILYLRGNLKF